MGDIHNRKAKMERTLEKLRGNPDISVRNKELVEKLVDHCLSEGISVGRTGRYVSSFNTLLPKINFEFDSCTEENLRSLTAKIEQSELNGKDYAEWTKIEFKKGIIKLLKVIEETDEKPEKASFITTHLPKSKEMRINPKDLPTQKDVKDMVKAADIKRDKCLIFLTYESGGRISEVANLKLKDIEFDNDIVRIEFRESKTRQRIVPLYLCTRHLREWYEGHPSKDDSDSYLFVNLGNPGYGEQMKYKNISRIYRKLTKEAEIGRKTNPHAFRKARATHLAAQGMNEAQLNEYFGCVQGSEQASRYVRLAKKDVENAVRRIHGLEVQDENGNGKEELKEQECPFCGEENSIDDNTCANYGRVLNQDAAIKASNEKQEAANELSELMDDPEVKELLKRKI